MAPELVAWVRGEGVTRLAGNRISPKDWRARPFATLRRTLRRPSCVID
jgi:hypothetical protein